MPAYLGIIRNRLYYRIRKTNSISVAFIVSELAQWRYQSLYDLLVSDNRFKLSILLVPFVSYSEKDKEDSLHRLRSYFKDKGIHYFDFKSYEATYSFLKTDIDPDLIFYPQPYDNCYATCLDSKVFEKKLICYFPYGMPTIREEWTFNLRFHNIAWRIYYQTSANWENFLTYSYIRGRNVRVVGDPIADQFFSGNNPDVWKRQDKKKKRVIWAPHYSITDNRSGMLSRNSFEWLSEAMLQIAHEYQETVQFSFKPHPRLLSELYHAKEWGVKRADDYYALWDQMPNTQLDTGDYVGLFMHSDALIHDSASFTAEYQFTGKPALFISDNIKKQESQLTTFGRLALACHYQGDSIDAIRSFIDKVVIGDEDSLADRRKDFRDNYLLPPGGLSAAKNVYDDILSSLGLKG